MRLAVRVGNADGQSVFSGNQAWRTDRNLDVEVARRLQTVAGYAIALGVRALAIEGNWSGLIEPILRRSHGLGDRRCSHDVDITMTIPERLMCAIGQLNARRQTTNRSKRQAEKQGHTYAVYSYSPISLSWACFGPEPIRELRIDEAGLTNTTVTRFVRNGG